MSRLLFLTLAGYCANLAGQPSGPPTVGFGYTLPLNPTVAPGQLVTLMVQGIDSGIRATVRAPANADLPTTLAGIQVSYWQGVGRLAPILEVRPFSGCGNPLGQNTCTALAAVTVQIPLDAQSLSSPGAVAVPQLHVRQNDIPGRIVEIYALTDQIHVLTSCDPLLSSASQARIGVTGLPCGAIVTHADGSLVSVSNPARPGEALVAYAVGMGQTNPPLATGKLVTAAAPTQTTFRLDFNYRPNALGTKPRSDAPQPIYAGATPGYVGLYQINFMVPPVPAGTPPCMEGTPLTNPVLSNLTVSVGGDFSFDAALICVAVPSP